MRLTVLSLFQILPFGVAVDFAVVPFLTGATIVQLNVPTCKISAIVPSDICRLAACQEMSFYYAPHAPTCFLSSAAKVHRQYFWMGRLGSPSPKRSVLWSSSKAIHEFRAYAKLSKKDRANCRQGLARSYKDASGKNRFSGVKQKLKKSQSLLSI